MKKKVKEMLRTAKVKKGKSVIESDHNDASSSCFNDFDKEAFEPSFDDDFSYFNATSASPMISDPLVIQYTNSTDSDIQGTLFGYIDFYASPNFNNAALEDITLLGGTYKAMMAYCLNKPFRIGAWRFQASGKNVVAQLAVTIKINQVDASNMLYSVPMNLSIMRDAYQKHIDILDVKRAVTMDVNTFCSFPVKANTTLVISLFPIDIFSAKSRLNKGKITNQREARRLSGKNVAPVIILSS